MSEVDTASMDYYAVQRHEVLDLIPKGTRTLLDVGCGKGVTGEIAKQMFDIGDVVGVEAVEREAREAAKRLDRVVVGDVETLDMDFGDGYFDCMIFADVLEHLRDPGKVLTRLRRYLKETGVVIASIPNLRNIVPLLKIVTDRFEYEDAGILDRTHMRFFTLHTMKLMFQEAGFRVVKIAPNRSSNRAFKLLRILTLGLLGPFFVYQYVLVAVKDGPPDSMGKEKITP